MKRNRTYFYLSTKGMEPCFLTKDKHQEAVRTWLCRGCKWPKKGIGAVDVTLEGKRPPKTPINFVFAASVGVAQRDFLEELGRETVQRDLLLGKVFNESNKELSDYISFRGRNALIVRGTKDARYRTCNECGRHLYFANPKWYLYPQPPPDFEVFESHSHQLILSETVFKRLTLNKWKRSLYVAELEVLDAPLDGFMDLLSLE